jgi:hypothetical protein
MILQHLDLKLTLPPDWMDQSQTIAAAPVKDGFKPNVVVTHDKLVPPETLEQLGVRQLNGLKGAFADLIVEVERSERFGPLRGYFREISFKLENKALSQFHYFAQVGDLAFFFTFTALRGSIADYLPVFKAMLSSVRLSSFSTDQFE